MPTKSSLPGVPSQVGTSDASGDTPECAPATSPFGAGNVTTPSLNRPSVLARKWYFPPASTASKSAKLSPFKSDTVPRKEKNPEGGEIIVPPAGVNFHPWRFRSS